MGCVERIGTFGSTRIHGLGDMYIADISRGRPGCRRRGVHPPVVKTFTHPTWPVPPVFRASKATSGSPGAAEGWQSRHTRTRCRGVYAANAYSREGQPIMICSVARLASRFS